MNWHSLLIAKLMSGLVKVQYCRALTALRYKVGSAIFGPSLMEKICSEDIGGGMDFEFFMSIYVEGQRCTCSE